MSPPTNHWTYEPGPAATRAAASNRVFFNTQVLVTFCFRLIVSISRCSFCQCDNYNLQYCSTDGATTLSRVNFSGYIGHATIFRWMFTIACCLVVQDSADVIPEVSEPANLVAHQRTQHSIVVHPTAVHAISMDICQTIVQHCRAPDFELTASCCVKLRLSLSLLSNPDLKLICFLPLSANYSTYLFRQRLCSRLTALWRYINFVLLLLLSSKDGATTLSRVNFSGTMRLYLVQCSLLQSV